MKDMIIFAMRDFIHRVIVQYLSDMMDIVPDYEYERLQNEFQTFESWLYRKLKE